MLNQLGYRDLAFLGNLGFLLFGCQEKIKYEILFFNLYFLW